MDARDWFTFTIVTLSNVMTGMAAPIIRFYFAVLIVIPITSIIAGGKSFGLFFQPLAMSQDK
jgi:hypothetical protein